MLQKETFPFSNFLINILSETELETWQPNCTQFFNSTREHVTVTEIGQNPFVSNLKLEKAQFWETGEYTCKYKDLEVEVSPSKA